MNLEPRANMSKIDKLFKYTVARCSTNRDHNSLCNGCSIVSARA